MKANVHKRRQERLRELQTRNRESIERAGLPDAPAREKLERGRINAVAGEPDRLPLWVRGPSRQEHGGDPELAWKQREKEMLSWYGDGDGRGGGFSPAEAGGPDGGGYASSGGARFGGGGPFRRGLLVKTVAAAIFFAGALGVSRLETPWASEAKRVMVSALTEDMDFGQAAAWYSRTFDGSPSFLPAFGSKHDAAKVQARPNPGRFVQPVKGRVKEAYSASKPGIWLETRKDAHVAAMEDGRIEFAGDRTDSGHTVVIQHSDGYRMTYGGLQPTKWESGDWVKAGDVIGTAAEDNGKGAVYLAVMKDQRYVDPLEVAAFD